MSKKLICMALLCMLCACSTNVETQDTSGIKEVVCSIVGEENSIDYRIAYYDESNVKSISFEVEFDMGIEITEELLEESRSAILSELEDVKGISATFDVDKEDTNVVVLVAKIDVETYDFTLDPAGVFNGDDLSEQTLSEIKNTLTTVGAVCKQ